MKPSLSRAFLRQRGAATLAVVMVLFFILAMVAAYTNRNMIFEQRTSSNSFRAAQSMSAAEAGLDWTLSMLNGGIVGPSCTSIGATDDFRNRYLTLKADGTFEAKVWGGLQAQPACIATDTGWNCTCPVGPPGNLTLGAEVTRPVFTTRFDPMNNLPGVIVLNTRGCDAARSGAINGGNVNSAGSCHIEPINLNLGGSGAVKVDSMATLRVAVALVPAMPVFPSAAMTVRGTVDQSAGELRVINPDSSTGVALRVGGAIVDPLAVKAAGPAGGTGEVTKAGDTTLTDVPASDFFRRSFNLPATRYGEQPAAVFVSCPLGCDASAVLYNGVTLPLTTLAAQNPTRIIYVNGNLTFAGLPGPVTIGTAALPTMLVVNGNLTFNQQVAFNGLIYVEGDVTWNAAAADGIVRGALLVRGNYAGSGTAAVSYDRAMVQQIRDGYGSFVRVPGSWSTRAGT
ncbi:PilX N-terminal domain-containing pilus assembly protein [Aquabacterium humicola]|uniref:PilX N-terminal domain-containing pilus assembly protein n=1 Tax=Aquabacterium humicola TaxID=3237377 RepID=UPI0025427F34|nr:PilX N-terminal domain-containing pilus assembly protein [Rubrivivax pictus]